MTALGGPSEQLDPGVLPGPRPRAPRVLDFGDGGLRSVAIAVASTAIVFGGLALLIVSAPGWATVQESFFNADQFVASWPAQVDAFLQNVQLFLIAELLILPLALVIAVMRSLPGPTFLPLRFLAVAYTDFFRGVPGILIIFALGFGIPALGLPNAP